MAHPSKFVSVNLNKSYGHSKNQASSPYASSARARPGSHSGSSAGGGGGGMVVLSRPRSSSSSASVHKSSLPKLSVPSPLNLPSLRKESEKLDLSSASGSSARPGSSGIRSGSGSSSMGWTKPAPALLQDKEAPPPPGRSGSGSYLPPAARGIGQALPPSSSPRAVAEKAVFLRGDDFPSLKATLGSGTSKQKDLLNQKEKMKEDERGTPGFHSPLMMRPQMRSSRLVMNNNATGGDECGLSHGLEQSHKQQQQERQEKYFPGPLPLVKLSHTSDWADDERDTGLSLPERVRDQGFSRKEFSWDVEVGSFPSRELYKGDSSGRRGLIGSNKDGRDVTSSWRMLPPSQPRDDRVGSMKSFGVSREVNKDSSFSHSPYGSNARDAFSNVSPDSWNSQRDLSFGLNAQNGKNVADRFNGRGLEQQNVRSGHYSDHSGNNRYGGDNFQQNAVPNVTFSYGRKGLPLNDPTLNFGREKRLNSSNTGKPYAGDVVFDGIDPFSDDPIMDVNLKVFKKKKEIHMHDDFHDPVRESFEAELERVQRIQEQERQRVMEEQARVMELARREQEERERLAMEEDARRRLIEEEAREAAWRVEQERMETARRAEEQKIAREEEKRRMLMEEERRKESARQKLMELEARIARRQSETTQIDDNIAPLVRDEPVPNTVNEIDVPRVAADVGDWEDGERMVEHITSTPSDSSMNMYFETCTSRFSSTRDAGSSLMERGKQGNYWKRDAYDNGANSMLHSHDQDSDYRSLRRDTFGSGRGFPRKDSYVNFGVAPMSPSSKGGSADHSSGHDDPRYLRGNRWNIGGESDHFTRNLEADAANFLDNDRFGAGGWGASRPRGSANSLYAEKSLQNSEVDGGFPSYGRSRHSLRQPRVLPPPSISSMRQSQSSIRGAQDRPISSPFLDNQLRYQQGGHNVEEITQSGYNGGYLERVQQPRTPEVLENDVTSSEQKGKDSPRCDSQSSLSVSNPPSSPTQLSHDDLDEVEDSRDLDEVEDSRALQTSPVEEQTVLFESELAVSGIEGESTNRTMTPSSISHGEDDEWAIENNEEMQEQEEYDEEEEGYQEEDEAAHVGGENLELSQDFDGQASDLPNVTGDTGQLVLGFDEGVEVIIPMDEDFEKTSVNLERAVLEDSVGCHRLHVDDTTFTEELIGGESSKIISETEKSLQELVLDPVSTSNSNPLVSTESVSFQGRSDQQPINPPLSLPMPSTSTVQPISSTVYTVDTQAEAPIRLQFGLFSGPPLIPSPVPAIQIGSIQMPLHEHPHVGASITQMQAPQPPFFQFGQLRYPSPISQGILSIAPQTVSFVHPPPHAQYPSAQNLGGSQHNQSIQHFSSQNNTSDKLPAGPIEDQAGLLVKPLDREKVNFEHMNEFLNSQNNVTPSQGQSDAKNRQVLGYQNVRHAVRDFNSRKNYRHAINNIESHGPTGDVALQLPAGEKAQIGRRDPGIVSGSRGNRFTYTVRNGGTRLPFSMPENSRTDSSVLQRRHRRTVRRTEFRVRENVDKRRREGLDTNKITTSQVEWPNFSGRMLGNSARYVIRRDYSSNKSYNTPVESENINSGASRYRVGSSDGKAVDKSSGKEIKSKKHLHSLEDSQAKDNGKKTVISEEDVDAPIQSGVVRIFNQPGIEAPSDEDDFIEVRSKRQMLNDRREQREKEIKSKTKVIKAPRKHRAVPQSNAVISNSKKTIAPLEGNKSYGVHPGHVITGGRGLTGVEASPVFAANMTSQPLAPIGTPPPKVDNDARSNNLKSNLASTISAPSTGPPKFVPGLSFDSKNTGLVNVSLSLSSWINPDISQQVMALTQSQLDDAMKPVQFDSQVDISLEPTKASTSTMTQEKSFLPSASSLNSLLAGERIQFGAVTSPTIIPPVTRAASNGVGAPGSSRSDVSKENLSTTNEDSTMFFDKDKRPAETCTHLEDHEAEAEAAASAVSAAAISNSDETVGNMLGDCAIQESKSFSGTDNSESKTSTGVTSSQVPCQSAAEESLTVALPADLSVDTHSLPLWLPLPSPQSTTVPSLSHFPGGPHSHFQMGFDINPVFGGPFIAFGPHDESGGTQVQPQRSTPLGSGPLGAWPQCHSGVDSFYGPTAGFTGPYISPPGGIPGVQAPHHMVVYNHFAPVGQFGQVGLSFMGATYIPTGKQPDWKHNPVSSSAIGVSDADINNTNVVSAQRNAPSMPSAIQHVAPGSPLMPIASPLAMFDMSPFQSSAEIPYQARWSHVPAPPNYSVPLTMPLQQQQPPQQVGGGMPSQFSGSLAGDTSAMKDRFNDHRSSPSHDGNRSFSVPNDSARLIPGDLHDHSSVSTTNVQSARSSYNPPGTSNSKSSNGSKTLPGSAVSSASESVGSSNGGRNAAASFKPQVSQQQPASSNQQQCLHQKTTPAGEWHRRMGYNGRGQAPDKGFAHSKMKQIYVAKPPARGPPAAG